jgi:antitoxin PrlF
MTHHSTVTSKGQTTIPREVREALNIKTGDRVEFALEADHATLRVHPGAGSLKGALASNKGRGISFDRIRQIAAKRAARRLEK